MSVLRMNRRAFAAVSLGALLSASAAFAQTSEPKSGGTLVYLEQQAHTVLYPPAGADGGATVRALHPVSHRCRRPDDRARPGDPADG